MKKKFLFVVMAMMFIVASAHASITLRYYNKDSQKHEMKVKISGSSKTVEFGSSRTASVTIQGSATTCEIETACGKVTVKDGDNIEIKDGCIKIK